MSIISLIFIKILNYCFCKDWMNISVAILSYVRLVQLLSIHYQKKHMKYSLIWKECHLEHRRVFLCSYLFYVLWKAQLNPGWQTDLSDKSILVSETIRISMFLKIASGTNSILFLIEFMLIWLIITLFRFFILNFFNVSSKLPSADWHVIKSEPLTFLDRPWKISL